MYQTVRYEIKEGHDMYRYCRQVCRSFKNMYNVTNFYIRQLLTGFKKDEPVRTPNEWDAIRDVTQMLGQRNREPDRKTGKPKKQLPVPSAKNPYLGYEQLNGFFVMQKNPDYYAMQANISQCAIKKCVMAWQSYYATLEAYKENPGRFRGKPRYPKYCKGEQMTAWLTNHCLSVKNGVLRLAGVDDTGGTDAGYAADRKRIKGSFRLGGYKSGCRIEKAEIQPYYSRYLLLVTYKADENDSGSCVDTSKETETGAVMGIDLGIQNAAAIADNTGERPVVMKGGFLKSRNQYYNKYHAVIKSRLDKEKDGGRRRNLQKKLDVLGRNREVFLRDCYYRMAHRICRLAESRGVSRIAVGHTKGWKQDADMGRKNNQAFVSLPLQKFVRILGTVGRKYGIRAYEQEESYTSKADFLCRDEIPVYKKEGGIQPVFSGKREKRGLYASGCGKLVNADVNAAFNIARKCFGDEASAGYGEGCMDSADAWNYRDFYPLRKETNWVSQPIA